MRYMINISKILEKRNNIRRGHILAKQEKIEEEKKEYVKPEIKPVKPEEVKNIKGLDLVQVIKSTHIHLAPLTTKSTMVAQPKYSLGEKFRKVYDAYLDVGVVPSRRCNRASYMDNSGSMPDQLTPKEKEERTSLIYRMISYIFGLSDDEATKQYLDSPNSFFVRKKKRLKK